LLSRDFDACACKRHQEGTMANKENCKAKDCSHEAVGKGYCRKHFRLWKAGEMPKARYKTCTFEKCRKHRHGTSSLCEEHFKAKHGKGGEAPAAAPAAPAAEAAPAS
jgi:hypothetical protein